MALASLDTLYRFYIIGWSRYNFNGQEGGTLICIDDFEENNKDQSGSNATPVSAPYTEFPKMEVGKMSLSDPWVIEFYGRLANRQGKSVLVATEVLRLYDPKQKPSASTTSTAKS